VPSIMPNAAIVIRVHRPRVRRTMIPLPRNSTATPRRPAAAGIRADLAESRSLSPGSIAGCFREIKPRCR